MGKVNRAAKASKKTHVVPSNAAHLLIVLSLLTLTLAAYSNSFSAGFALDNGMLILQDSRIRAVTPENLNLILRHTYWWPYGESGLYRPFTTLTYLFNYAVLENGAQAFGYHVVNLLLHALNVMLVYILARRFFSGRWPPAALAGLWAVHPALTESVTNIVGRADLLAGAAILGGFWLYLKSAEATGSRRLPWLAALFAAAAIGVFSKENGVAILGVIAVYEFLWWNPKKRFSQLLPAWCRGLASRPRHVVGTLGGTGRLKADDSRVHRQPAGGRGLLAGQTYRPRGSGPLHLADALAHEPVVRLFVRADPARQRQPLGLGRVADGSRHPGSRCLPLRTKSQVRVFPAFRLREHRACGQSVVSDRRHHGRSPPLPALPGDLRVYRHGGVRPSNDPPISRRASSRIGGPGSRVGHA